MMLGRERQPPRGGEIGHRVSAGKSEHRRSDSSAAQYIDRGTQRGEPIRRFDLYYFIGRDTQFGETGRVKTTEISCTALFAHPEDRLAFLADAQGRHQREGEGGARIVRFAREDFMQSRTGETQSFIQPRNAETEPVDAARGCKPDGSTAQLFQG